MKLNPQRAEYPSTQGTLSISRHTTSLVIKERQNMEQKALPSDMNKIRLRTQSSSLGFKKSLPIEAASEEGSLSVANEFAPSQPRENIPISNNRKFIKRMLVETAKDHLVRSNKPIFAKIPKKVLSTDQQDQSPSVKVFSDCKTLKEKLFRPAVNTDTKSIPSAELYDLYKLLMDDSSINLDSKLSPVSQENQVFLQSMRKQRSRVVNINPARYKTGSFSKDNSSTKHEESDLSPFQLSIYNRRISSIKGILRASGSSLNLSPKSYKKEVKYPSSHATPSPKKNVSFSKDKLIILYKND